MTDRIELRGLKVRGNHGVSTTSAGTDRTLSWTSPSGSIWPPPPPATILATPTTMACWPNGPPISSPDRRGTSSRRFPGDRRRCDGRFPGARGGSCRPQTPGSDSAGLRGCRRRRPTFSPGRSRPGGAGGVMSRVVLSIGSNLGDRLARLQAAVDALGRSVLAVSPVYETDAWGGWNRAVLERGGRRRGSGARRGRLVTTAQAIERDNERVRERGKPHLWTSTACCVWGVGRSSRTPVPPCRTSLAHQRASYWPRGSRWNPMQN